MMWMTGSGKIAAYPSKPERFRCFGRRGGSAPVVEERRRLRCLVVWCVELIDESVHFLVVRNGRAVERTLVTAAGAG